MLILRYYFFFVVQLNMIIVTSADLHQRVEIKKGLKNVFGSLHGKKKIGNQNRSTYCFAHFFFPLPASNFSSNAFHGSYLWTLQKMICKSIVKAIFFFSIISPRLFKEDGSASHTHANTLFKWWFEYSCFDLAGEILQSGECAF